MKPLINLSDLISDLKEVYKDDPISMADTHYVDAMTLRFLEKIFEKDSSVSKRMCFYEDEIMEVLNTIMGNKERRELITKIMTH